MDYKFVVVLLLGVCNGINFSSSKIDQRAYDLLYNIYKFRVNNNSNRLVKFPQYTEKGFSSARAYHDRAKGNLRAK